MADNNRRGFLRRRKKELQQGNTTVNSLVNNVEDTMRNLYADTYFSDRTNMDNMSAISDRIEDNISEIIRRNSKYDISNTSKLYSRLMRQSHLSTDKMRSEKALAGELETLFGDSSFTDAILGSYLSNKWIADLDQEIDSILKYCPNIKEALDVLKDAVLSADSSAKDFIYPKVAISNDAEMKKVIDRIDKMGTKYEIANKVEDWYDSASHYGEAFVYLVPYAKAIGKLLQQKQKVGTATTIQMPVVEHGVINESVFLETKSAESFKDLKLKSDCSFSVEIDTTCILASSINEAKSARNSRRDSPISLIESYITDIREGTVTEKTEKLDKIVPDELQIPDGLNDPDTGKYVKGISKREEKIDVRGAVVKTLNRQNLIRLYVDNICLGYYYLEFKQPSDLNMSYYMDSEKNLGYSKSISTIQKTITDNLEDSRVDHMMRTIAKQMSDKLDATFINANQDITQEIYAILKYNDVFNSNTSVRVSFLPPEDVKWLRFREDPTTHVGISDVNDSILPAKLLAMLYITYVTGTLTRGQDKRVYYVKQTIETNIAQTLLNVINQIKKSNFNMRAIENLNNLLNITGRFNDYIIPVGPSGDSPIQFEIMPGQQFEINQDLFNLLTEQAVNNICPLEIVQARMNPDFATQYTSSSLKLLRKTYRRQGRMEMFISDIYESIYMTEYGEFQQIDCELPPPIFLSMVNTNQLLENTTNYVNAIAEMEYAGEQGDTVDQEKAIFIKKMVKSIIGTYIKPSEIERAKQSAKFEMSKNIHQQGEE